MRRLGVLHILQRGHRGRAFSQAPQQAADERPEGVSGQNAKFCAGHFGNFGKALRWKIVVGRVRHEGGPGVSGRIAAFRARGVLHILQRGHRGRAFWIAVRPAAGEYRGGVSGRNATFCVDHFGNFGKPSDGRLSPGTFLHVGTNRLEFREEQPLFAHGEFCTFCNGVPREARLAPCPPGGLPARTSGEFRDEMRRFPRTISEFWEPSIVASR